MTVFELVAKLTLDSNEYERGLDSASQKAAGFGKVIKGVAKAVAVGALVKKTVDLTKAAVAAYGEYEQLAGGISKLYGTASDEMMQYAQQAYKTSGMSANQYMKNVTGFSASLLNSVKGDSKEAARIADMAMQDISDNANTFGKYTAEELAGVYQALAKGQYQTLDNLNLGFGGTKEGMQGLIDKANELAIAQGKAGDLTIDSYADIVEAIHLVQDDLKITGTTQKEAAKTIQGSIQMTKAAWQNFITGLADPNANLADLTKKVIESAGTAAKNLVPAIGQALKGIGQVIAEFAPQLIEDGINAFTNFAEGFAEGSPQIVPKVMNVLMLIASTLVKNAPRIISAAFKLAVAIAKGIITGIPQVISAVIKTGAEIIKGLDIGQKVSQVMDKVKSAVSDKLEAAKNVVTRWIQKIKNLFPFKLGKLFTAEIPTFKATVSKGSDGSADMHVKKGTIKMARAMAQPYVFKRETQFMAGEAGDEVLYGRNALMKDIAKAAGNNGNIVINLNYDASADATEMLNDLVRGVRRYRMAGVI